MAHLKTIILSLLEHWRRPTPCDACGKRHDDEACCEPECVCRLRDR